MAKKPAPNEALFDAGRNDARRCQVAIHGDNRKLLVRDASNARLTKGRNRMCQTKRWLVLVLLWLGSALIGVGQSGPQQSSALEEADRLDKRAHQLFNDRRFDEAISLEIKVLAILEKELGPNDLVFGDAVHNLALLYDEIQDYTRAEPLHKRALAIRERALGLEHPRVADALNSLALSYDKKGDYERAKPLYQQALAIREKVVGKHHPTVAAMLHNLADLYEAQGDYAHAEAMHRRALAIWEESVGRLHPDFATSLSSLAGLYEVKGDYARAEALRKVSLTIREILVGKKHPDVAVELYALGTMYHTTGDYTRAEAMYQQALAIWEESVGKEHPFVSHALNNLAMLHKAKGDYKQAKSLYQRALAIREKVNGKDHPFVAAVLNNLAGLCEAQGDYTRAVQFQMREEDICEYNLAVLLTTGSESQKQLYLNSLADRAYPMIPFHIRSAPTNIQAAQLALTKILRRKGRALDAMTDHLARLRLHGALQDEALLDQYASAISYLATLQVSGGGNWSPEERRQRIINAQDEVQRLQGTISRRSADFSAESQRITLEAVREALPADAALVEILVYNPVNVKARNDAEWFGAARYVAYVLRHETATPLWVDFRDDAASIDAEVERLRVALKDMNRTDVKVIARAVDEKVMRPIRKLLGQTRRIFLSPDGALNLIPFEALVDENGKYLIENYSLSYLTSGRDLLRFRAQVENRSPSLIMADPLFDMRAATRPRRINSLTTQPVTQSGENRRSTELTVKSYKPLSGTAEEAKALGKLMSEALVLTQEGATESALKRVRHPRVLHIATHGFFLADLPHKLTAGVGQMRLRGTFDSLPLPERWENPLLRSGLILAGVNQQQSGIGEDGVLTALEVAGLDLSGTKLVVLSACETALGDIKNGEGVYGLRRALVLAGSQTQVMSLWKVSDTGTRDLMVAYYTRLKAGEGRTEALRQVQLAMLRGQLTPTKATQSGRRETSDTAVDAAKDYRHPYYWAAFIASGDWRNMNGKEVRSH